MTPPTALAPARRVARPRSPERPAPARDRHPLRDVLAAVPTPVVFIGAVGPDGPTGMVAGSFVGLSLEPPLAAVAFQRTSSTWPVLRAAGRLGVSVLAAPHADRVRTLAGPARHRLDGSDHRIDGGAVLLEDAAAHLVTRVNRIDDAGDHDLAILEVLGADVVDPAALPLVFHSSRVSVHGAAEAGEATR